MVMLFLHSVAATAGMAVVCTSIKRIFNDANKLVLEWLSWRKYAILCTIWSIVALMLSIPTAIYGAKPHL